jgi:malonyl-CoA/methylmalonyl-CoA synthetase
MSEALTWESHLAPGTYPASLNLLAEESLVRAWASRFVEIPNQAAICSIEDGRWLTYRELELRSRLAASRLSGAGLNFGDRVIFSAKSSIDLVVAYVGAQRLGLVVVPVDPAFSQREVEYVVADANPRAAIIDDLTHTQWLRGVEIICGPEIELAHETDPTLDRATRDDIALIAYTSGTTGTPKGAMLSSGNLLASAQALRIAWRWSRDDRLILALPLFHMHGLGVGLNGTLTAGASLVLVPKFDVEVVLDSVSSFKATLFFGVPTMYARLAASPRVAELSQLRLCVSGSAPLPGELHRTFAAQTSQHIIERYGMTETAMNTSNPYDGERRAGSVGFPLPGVSVRLADDSEIQLRGPNVFRGYWRRPEATEETFTKDGWFRTGDLGVIDDRGYLSIIGRTKDLIITGGHNVYPREIEEVLLMHSGVREVAVAGIASPEWGEIVGAWIVPHGEMDTNEVLAFAAQRLASYKRPRVVQLLNELPRNALGKVVKRNLPTMENTTRE